MKRDFTRATYDEFCAMIQQINDDQWGGISDWFGDRFLDVKHWLSDLGILDYTNNMDKYYRELLDRKNTSKKEMKRIFEDISSLDKSYANDQAGHFGEYKNQLETYREYVATLNQIAVGANTIMASGGDWRACFNSEYIRNIMKTVDTKFTADLSAILFTADTFSKIPEDYKKEYIAVYEAEHPDQAKLMESVLSDPDLTEQEKRDIKFLAYTAPEPYRSVYLEHLSQYNVVVFQPDSADSDGKSGSCYWSKTGKIYLKDDDSTFGDNKRAPYDTFFHESGHALDDYEKGQDLMSRSYFHNGISLQDYIVDDVRDYVSNYIDENYAGKLTQEQKNQLMKSMNLTDDASFAYEGSTAGLPTALEDYRAEIVAGISNNLTGHDNNAASDVYGGVTNNVFMGSYGHFKDENASGDSYTYWYQNGKATRSQSSELFAEFFAAQMTRDEVSLANIRKHFPQAYEAMEAMVREMAGN